MSSPTPLTPAPENTRLPGVVLPDDRRSAGAARQLIRDATADVSKHAREIAVLLASEVVGNAVTHAHSACWVHVCVTGDEQIHVEVTDGDPTAPHLGPRCDNEEISGRGMVLVDALAARWGCTPVQPAGKTVWFYVDT
jgi:anti-sigma regulatory factor (Ser/Thr protein kinase)